jgi:hypothetical protein
LGRAFSGTLTVGINTCCNSSYTEGVTVVDSDENTKPDRWLIDGNTVLTAGPDGIPVVPPGAREEKDRLPGGIFRWTLNDGTKVTTIYRIINDVKQVYYWQFIKPIPGGDDLVILFLDLNNDGIPEDIDDDRIADF